MNPWGFVAIGVGVLLIIIGVTGSYDNVKAAITGRAPTQTKAQATTVARTPGVKLL
jgi:hypothetical protein